MSLGTVASGDSNQTVKLIDAGAIEPLISLLSCANWEVREQAVWALGNIAGDGPETRNHLLKCGIMPELIKMIASAMNSPLPKSLMRNSAWTLSNMFRGRPGPQIDLVRDALPHMNTLLRYPDSEVAVDVMWGVHYATDGGEDRIQAVIDAGIIDTVLQLLPESEEQTMIPGIRTIGNVIVNTSRFTDSLIQRGVVPLLLRIIKRASKPAAHEVLWTLSNFALESSASVQCIIDAGGVDVFTEYIFSSDMDLRKEAAWCLANCLDTAADAQIAQIADRPRAVKALAQALKLKETRVLLALLEAAGKLFAFGDTLSEGVNRYVNLFEEEGGATNLEELEQHVDDEVYTAASELIDNYFTDGLIVRDETTMTDSGPFSVPSPSTPLFSSSAANTFGSGTFGSGTFGSGSFGASTPLSSTNNAQSTPDPQPPSTTGVRFFI